MVCLGRNGVEKIWCIGVFVVIYLLTWGMIGLGCLREWCLSFFLFAFWKDWGGGGEGG